MHGSICTKYIYSIIFYTFYIVACKALYQFITNKSRLESMKVPIRFHKGLHKLINLRDFVI